MVGIQVQADIQKPTFRKNGADISYLLPPDYAIVENGNTQIKSNY